MRTRLHVIFSGKPVALSKTKHGTFSRTTDCVTPLYPAAPPTQQQLLGDLDETLIYDQAAAQAQTQLPVGATAANQSAAGPGRMITTSIDEGVFPVVPESPEFNYLNSTFVLTKRRVSLSDTLQSFRSSPQLLRKTPHWWREFPVDTKQKSFNVTMTPQFPC